MANDHAHELQPRAEHDDRIEDVPGVRHPEPRPEPDQFEEELDGEGAGEEERDTLECLAEPEWHPRPDDAHRESVEQDQNREEMTKPRPVHNPTSPRHPVHV